MWWDNTLTDRRRSETRGLFITWGHSGSLAGAGRLRPHLHLAANVIGEVWQLSCWGNVTSLFSPAESSSAGNQRPWQLLTPTCPKTYSVVKGDGNYDDGGDASGEPHSGFTGGEDKEISLLGWGPFQKGPRTHKSWLNNSIFLKCSLRQFNISLLIIFDK